MAKHQAVIAYYCRKYMPDSCSRDLAFVYSKAEGLGYIGDINHNKISDSVFILPPLSLCSFPGEPDNDGQAYYFLDTTLPRLQTASYCCHPNSLFSVGDIDEDGVQEIGQYFSSCASRYKSLYVYTLKQGQWKEAGHVVYDLFYADPKIPYASFVRKTGKNYFEMLEITDLTDHTYIGKKHWVKFAVKNE